MNELLGERVTQSERLSPDTWLVRTDVEAEFVVKRVPRQERHRWTPGNPWTELVVLDVLAAEGGPVPPLVAVDLMQGYLVQKFISGQSLRHMTRRPDFGIMTSLAKSLEFIESVLQRETKLLAPYLVVGDHNERELFTRYVGQVLEEEERKAWESLVDEGFSSSGSGPDVDGGIGSLDVQPDNALVSGSQVTLLDFATIGTQYRERRLIGYVHRARPVPGTLLDERGYASYALRYGRAASIRLAFYDFAYTLKIIETLMTSHPKEDESPIGEAMEMWRRPRLADERIDRIRLGVTISDLEDFFGPR